MYKIMKNERCSRSGWCTYGLDKHASDYTGIGINPITGACILNLKGWKVQNFDCPDFIRSPANPECSIEIRTESYKCYDNVFEGLDV